MPISKDQQKLMVFINKRTKEMVERIINVESAVTRLSGSALLEQHLLNDLLPSNEIGRDLYKKMYCDTPIKNVLASLFNMNASGSDFKSRWSPNSIRPFVEFAHELMVANHWRNSGNEYNNEEIPYLLSQLNSLSNILKKKNQEDSSALLGDTIHFFDDFISLSNKNIEEVRMHTYVRIILENWELLKDSTYTYRALYAIMLTDYSWKVTDEEFFKLGELIKKHSLLWD